MTLDGCLLPPQLLYQSTTSACLPSTTFPSGWYVTCHLISGQMRVLQRIIFLSPYLSKKQMELKCSSDQWALCIFDNFKGQLTDDVLQMLEDIHIDIVFVPLNFTDRLQFLDLSVNKSAKHF